jgi:hypothetical protein
MSIIRSLLPTRYQEIDVSTKAGQIQQLREAIEKFHPGLDPILWEFDAWQGKK